MKKLYLLILCSSVMVRAEYEALRDNVYAAIQDIRQNPELRQEVETIKVTIAEQAEHSRVRKERVQAHFAQWLKGEEAAQLVATIQKQGSGVMATGREIFNEGKDIKTARQHKEVLAQQVVTKYNEKRLTLKDAENFARAANEHDKLVNRASDKIVKTMRTECLPLFINVAHAVRRALEVSQEAEAINL